MIRQKQQDHTIKKTQSSTHTSTLKRMRTNNSLFRKSMVSCMHFEKNEFGDRRQNLMFHQRMRSLHKTSQQNIAMLQRINSQKAVVKTMQSKSKKSNTKISHLLDKQNLDTHLMDIIIKKKTTQIDRVLKQKPKSPFFIF